MKYWAMILVIAVNLLFFTGVTTARWNMRSDAGFVPVSVCKNGVELGMGVIQGDDSTDPLPPGSTYDLHVWGELADDSTLLFDRTFVVPYDPVYSNPPNFTSTLLYHGYFTVFWEPEQLLQVGEEITITEELSDAFLVTVRDCILPPPATISACNVAHLEIPDSPSGGVADTITVSGNGTLADLDVYIDTEHAWVGDLELTLEHDGTTVTLLDRPGHPDSPLACQGDAIAAILDDTATLPAESSCIDEGGLFETGLQLGPYSPSESLGIFAGTDLDGDWTLSVSDNQADNTGMLVEWCVKATMLGDDFDHPFVIDSLPSNHSTDTTVATEGYDDPQATCGDPSKSVWYQFTAPESETVSFDTDGSDYDTWLAVYHGTRGNLTEIACNDNYDGSATARVEVPVDAGTTYHVMVGGKNGEAGNLVFDAAQETYSVFLPASMDQYPSATTPSDLANGDFESGPTAWTEVSLNGYPLILDASDLVVPPHGGSWAVWLGGAFNEISYVEQDVTVPASAPFLSYWHWIASEDTCGYDFGGVIVDESTVVDVYDLCTSTETGGWVQHTVDLRAYAGQTIAFQIRAETDGSWNSNLFVDDVSFVAGATSSAVTPPDVDSAYAAMKRDSAKQGSDAHGGARKLLTP